jgi:hypothetical protein
MVERNGIYEGLGNDLVLVDEIDIISGRLFPI